MPYDNVRHRKLKRRSLFFFNEEESTQFLNCLRLRSALETPERGLSSSESRRRLTQTLSNIQQMGENLVGLGGRNESKRSFFTTGIWWKYRRLQISIEPGKKKRKEKDWFELYWVGIDWFQCRIMDHIL